LIDGEDLDVRSGFLFSAGPDAFKALCLYQVMFTPIHCVYHSHPVRM
jgi:hypothetical protein